MIPVIFDYPPPPRGDTQQQLDELRRWAEMLTNKLRQMAAELDSDSASRGDT